MGSRLKVFRIQPIVEGHGEVDAVPILLRRLGSELLSAAIEVLRPIRQPKYSLLNRQETLGKATGIAANKLAAATSSSEDMNVILLLMDADEEPACILGPDLLSRLHSMRGDLEFICVVATVEFETWFVAAAASLERYLDLTGTTGLPENPESSRLGKGWIQARFRGTYKETVDQPKLTASMDLESCRRNSRSFDKLCRGLEKYTAGQGEE